MITHAHRHTHTCNIQVLQNRAVQETSFLVHEAILFGQFVIQPTTYMYIHTHMHTRMQIVGQQDGHSCLTQQIYNTLSGKFDLHPFMGKQNQKTHIGRKPK